MRVAELHVTWDEFRTLVGTKGHERFEERIARYLKFARTCAPQARVAELSEMRDGSILLVPHADPPPERVVFRELEDDAGQMARNWHDAQRAAANESPLTGGAAPVR